MLQDPSVPDFRPDARRCARPLDSNINSDPTSNPSPAAGSNRAAVRRSGETMRNAPRRARQGDGAHGGESPPPASAPLSEQEENWQNVAAEAQRQSIDLIERLEDLQRRCALEIGIGGCCRGSCVWVKP